MGFCSHFWVNFIVSLKQDFFQMENWTLTALPVNFNEELEDLKMEIEKENSEESVSTPTRLKIIDKGNEDYNLLQYFDDRITVYEANITEIEEKSYEYQGRITEYYLVTLQNVRYGPQIKRKSDYDEDKIVNREKLLIRLSEKKFTDTQPEVGDILSCNGTVKRDDFLGILLKRVTKVKKGIRKEK